MSNCVHIYDTTVFPFGTIDHERLFKEAEKIQSLPESPKDFKGSTIWWFLGSNNMWIEKSQLHINLGDARSSHTQRDLRQVFYVLSEYLYHPERDMKMKVNLSDEYDGFKQKFWYEFDVVNADEGNKRYRAEMDELTKDMDFSKVEVFDLTK